MTTHDLLELGAPTPDRLGDWCQSVKGRQLWPFDPRPEDVDPEEVAHALSLLCRYAGHCRVFFSVAEHSVRASRAAEAEAYPTRGAFVRHIGRYGGERLREFCLALLVHDGAEGLGLTDLVRPVKVNLPAYKAMEGPTMRAVEVAFGLPEGRCDARDVKFVDAVMLTTEKRDLLARPPAPWGFPQRGMEVDPLRGTIRPWSWRRARAEWLYRYAELRGDRGLALWTRRLRAWAWRCVPW